MSSEPRAHHRYPAILQNIIPLHATQLAVGAVAATQHKNPLWLRSQGQGECHVVAFRSNCICNKVLALGTILYKLCAKNNVLQIGSVEQCQADVLKNSAGTSHSAALVPLNPEQNCLKDLFLTLNLE